MQSSQFTVQGFTRTYWDFFLGAGFTVGVLYVFAAVLAWQLGGLPVATLASMRATTWSFAACFVAVTALSWRYLFLDSDCHGWCHCSLSCCCRMVGGEGLQVKRGQARVPVLHRKRKKLTAPLRR
jgi:hypothetical protein